MATAQQPLPGRVKPPFSVFSTDRVGTTDRFEAWRQSIGVIFEVEPREKRLAADFNASVRTYNLGEILVSATRFGAELFKRDLRKISSDGIDHYLIQLYDVGRLVGATRRNDMNVRPGDIQIVDLGQPHTSTVQNSATVVIVVRRDLMAEMVPAGADLHGVVLRGDGGAGGLLADYMKSLYARMDSVDTAEAPYLARATVQMIAACFRPSAAATGRARAQIERVIVERLKRHIEQNLGSRELTPDGLCRRFRISRTQLYRMFEPLGGVAKYIQARRLDRAHAQLRNPLYHHRRVFEIALNAGFSSVTHFSGAFRRQFGLSPSDLRDNVRFAAISGGLRSQFARGAEGYEDWLKRLGQQDSNIAQARL